MSFFNRKQKKSTSYKIRSFLGSFGFYVKQIVTYRKFRNYKIFENRSVRYILPLSKSEGNHVFDFYYTEISIDGVK